MSDTQIVNMPSGTKGAVSKPTNQCSCIQCTFTVVLRPVAVPEFQVVAQEMTATIVQHAMQEHGGGRFSKYNVVRVDKVDNPCLYKRFRNKERELYKELKYVNEKMLFHGSKAIDDIIKNGFDTKKANSNGMFGPGIYFASHSSKSNQYVYGYLGGNGCPVHSDKSCYICERRILLCRVALGRMYKLTEANKLEQPPKRYNSVSGEPGKDLKYPEYAIYHGDQAYPEFVITYKIVK